MLWMILLFIKDVAFTIWSILGSEPFKKVVELGSFLIELNTVREKIQNKRATPVTKKKEKVVPFVKPTTPRKKKSKKRRGKKGKKRR